MEATDTDQPADEPDHNEFYELLMHKVEQASIMWITENTLQCMFNGHDVATFAITIRELTTWLAEKAMDVLEDEALDDHSRLTIIVAMLVGMGKTIESVIINPNEDDEAGE